MTSKQEAIAAKLIATIRKFREDLRGTDLAKSSSDPDVAIEMLTASVCRAAAKVAGVQHGQNASSSEILAAMIASVGPPVRKAAPPYVRFGELSPASIEKALKELVVK